jgi:D-3-phosphoglycerate dehydrogenase
MKVLVSTSSFCEFSNSPLGLLENEKLEIIENPYSRKMKPEEILNIAKDVDYVVAGTETYNPALIDEMSNLKIISRVGVGLDNIDLHYAKKKGIKIFNTSLSPSLSVAEFTLSLMLSSLKNLNKNFLSGKNGSWVKNYGTLLSNKVVGIVGAGNIGKKLIDFLDKFNNKILIFDILEDSYLKNKKNVTYTSIQEVFKSSEIISIHLPLTEETKYLIDSKLLKIMKEDALLINTSRGEIINEKDLFSFLKRNKKVLACLDVFEVEPYQGPLMELKNLNITPHVSAYAKETRIDMELEAVKNLIYSLN